jgi:hypothetical protein
MQDAHFILTDTVRAPNVLEELIFVFSLPATANS